ncbi:MAG: hypothetical protein R3A11_00025 [Bdellovibrionota bacterium]
MSKDKKGKDKEKDSLLEGFDDTFDDILSTHQDKTELFAKDDDFDGPTKTQKGFPAKEYTESLDDLFVPETEGIQADRTQMVDLEEDLMPEGTMPHIERTELVSLEDDLDMPSQRSAPATELIGEDEQFAVSNEKTEMEDESTQMEDSDGIEAPTKTSQKKVAAIHTELIGEDDEFELESSSSAHDQEKTQMEDDLDMSSDADVIQGYSTELVSGDDDDDWFDSKKGPEKTELDQTDFEQTQMEDSDGIEASEAPTKPKMQTELIGEDEQFAVGSKKKKAESGLSSGTELIGDDDEFADLFDQTDLQKDQTEMVGHTEAVDEDDPERTSYVSAESTDLVESHDTEDISSLFAEPNLMDDSKTKNQDIKVDEVLKDYLESSKPGSISSSELSLPKIEEELMPSMAASSAEAKRKQKAKNTKSTPLGLIALTLAILGGGGYVFYASKYTEKGFFGIHLNQVTQQRSPEEQSELIGKKLVEVRDLLLHDDYNSYEKAQVVLKEILSRSSTCSIH